MLVSASVDVRERDCVLVNACIKLSHMFTGERERERERDWRKVLIDFVTGKNIGQSLKENLNKENFQK